MKWTYLGDKSLYLYSVYDGNGLDASLFRRLYPDRLWEEGPLGWEVFRLVRPCPEGVVLGQVCGHAVRRALALLAQVGRWRDLVPVLRAREQALALLLGRLGGAGVRHRDLGPVIERLDRVRGRLRQVEAGLAERSHYQQVILAAWQALQGFLGVGEDVLAFWAEIAPPGLPYPPRVERSGYRQKEKKIVTEKKVARRKKEKIVTERKVTWEPVFKNGVPVMELVARPALHVPDVIAHATFPDDELADDPAQLPLPVAGGGPGGTARDTALCDWVQSLTQANLPAGPFRLGSGYLGQSYLEVSDPVRWLARLQLDSRNPNDHTMLRLRELKDFLESAERG